MRRLASIPGISSQGAAGIVLTAGFAAGYFLATWFKPLPLAVSSFLTGSVMTVSPADVAWASAVLLVAVGVVAAGHRQLLAHCFDPADPAAARGASRDERIILGLILAAVTVAIPAVGGPRTPERRRHHRAGERGRRPRLARARLDPLARPRHRTRGRGGEPLKKPGPWAATNGHPTALSARRQPRPRP